MLTYRLSSPIFYACILLLSACVSRPQSVQPLTSTDHRFQSDKIERSLTVLADQTHKDFVQQGLLINDIQLTGYLDQITRKLAVPLSLPVQPHYFILKDPSINAMAFPNGNIYINIGLITTLQSEDQLALVLAHETAHFVQRHSYKGQLDKQNAAVAAHVTDLLLFGTGLAYVPFGLGIQSFSREQEREADLLGIEYLAHTGYNLPEAIKAFDLLNETKHSETQSAWDNHPDLASRKKYSQQKVRELDKETSPPPQVEAYANIRKQVADLYIQTRLSNKQYELACDAAERENSRQGESAKWHSYRGDALLGSADNPDAAARENAWLYKKKLDEALKKTFADRKSDTLSQAIAAYQKAIQLDSAFAPAYRGLGLAALAQNRKDVAIQNLNRYLELNPSAKDRRYIESIVRKPPTGNPV